MLLSIITITYNNLSGLQHTIASVQQQTFSDYEQIVIDGASTDGTPDYLKTTNVRYVSEKDKGIYDAQNKGIALAKARGVYKGREKKELENFDEIAELWKNNEITATKASQLLGITRPTFYNRVNELGIKKITPEL